MTLRALGSRCAPSVAVESSESIRKIKMVSRSLPASRKCFRNSLLPFAIRFSSDTFSTITTQLITAIMARIPITTQPSSVTDLRITAK